MMTMALLNRPNGSGLTLSQLFLLTTLWMKMQSASTQLPTPANDTSPGKYANSEVITSDDVPVLNQTKELQLAVVQQKPLTLNMNEVKQVKVNFTLYCSHPSIRYSLRLSTDNAYVAQVDDFQLFNISCADAILDGAPTPAGSPDPDLEGSVENNQTGKQQSDTDALESIPVVRGQFNFSLHADLLGRTWLHMRGMRDADSAAVLPDLLVLPWYSPKTTNSSQDFVGDSVSSSDVPYDVRPSQDEADDVSHELEKHVVTVLRVVRPVDSMFRIVLYSFVVLNTIGMGCKTELSVVKGVLRKPIAPAIGFVCQYLFMPLIAFMLAKTLTVGDPAVSLGIFTCGICPGGGPSNMFSYLLDGDVSLSVTMTALSSIAALAMIPTWLFTLGSLFEDDKISLQVPFGKIIMTLSIIIIPLFVGVAIKKLLPRVSKFILKCLKPFTLVALIFLVTFGIYANLYVFRLFSTRTLLAGCMLPYIGYSLGGIVSVILRQPCFRVKTIAIETGIQNTSIAYLLLVFSLPAPDGDMAAVGPMASAVMTPLPLFVLVIVYLLYKRFCKKKEDKKENGGEKGSGDAEEDVALNDNKAENGHGNLQAKDKVKDYDASEDSKEKNDTERKRFLDNPADDVV